jgi:hypothetical protein
MNGTEKKGMLQIFGKDELSLTALTVMLIKNEDKLNIDVRI